MNRQTEERALARPMITNYLKYWRVIKFWVQEKYKLTSGELDMLLFLHDEEIFGHEKYNEFNELLSWNKGRLKKLIDEEWIEPWRKGNGKRGSKALYEVSYKTKRVVNSIYKKLSGEEIPESLMNNPIFYKNVSFKSKVYKNFIIQMNKDLRKMRASKRNNEL